MFSDLPQAVLPWHDKREITISWDTTGPLAGPFLAAVESKPVSNYAARLGWFEQEVERLEDYLPFDITVLPDNQPADIRISVVGNIPINANLRPGWYVAGMLLPRGSHHDIVLRDAPVSNGATRTLFHELGHAFGLSHPGVGGYDPNYTSEDTIMSYNRVHADTWFQKADLQRLQEIWGHDPTDIDPITGNRYGSVPTECSPVLQRRAPSKRRVEWIRGSIRRRHA